MPPIEAGHVRNGGARLQTPSGPSRRRFISAGIASMAVTALAGSEAVAETAQGRDIVPVARTVRALTFDVFGTVVDWRTSMIREGQLLGAAKGLEVDWARFADAWRAGYGPAMNRVR